MQRRWMCSRRWKNFPASARIRKPLSRRLSRCSRGSIRSLRRRVRRPADVSLTVDAVRYDIAKRRRHGVASTFLADRLSPGDTMKVYVQKAHGFAPAGRSGRADHHGRARHRRRAVPRLPAGAQATQATGRNWLFFGHQRSDYDFFYEDELRR